jgi:hypothetical protein
MIKQRSDVIVLMVLMMVCLSLYMDETMISLLGIISIIVYVYSLDNRLKSSGISNNPQKLEAQKNNQILKKETLANKETEPTTKKTDDKCGKKPPSKFYGNLKTQGNIFNKLNYDLYYNELGDQFNIQGFDSVKGFDKTIYD